MNKRILLGALFGAVISLSSCYQYYEDSAEISDLDLVVTNYNKDFAFASKKTYAMPDSVILINSEEFDGTHEYANPSYSKTMLTAIKTNMANCGWTLVDKTASPDVIILPSVSQTTNIYYYYSYSYWGSYYPGYSGGWGWYYPGYYYPPVASSYKTGSMLIQMTDPSGSATSDMLPVAWTAVINGLAEGNAGSITARIQTTIAQAFVQSPYLKK